MRFFGNRHPEVVTPQDPDLASSEAVDSLNYLTQTELNEFLDRIEPSRPVDMDPIDNELARELFDAIKDVDINTICTLSSGAVVTPEGRDIIENFLYNVDEVNFIDALAISEALSLDKNKSISEENISILTDLIPRFTEIDADDLSKGYITDTEYYCTQEDYEKLKRAEGRIRERAYSIKERIIANLSKLNKETSTRNKVIVGIGAVAFMYAMYRAGSTLADVISGDEVNIAPDLTGPGGIGSAEPSESPSPTETSSVAPSPDGSTQSPSPDSSLLPPESEHSGESDTQPYNPDIQNISTLDNQVSSGDGLTHTIIDMSDKELTPEQSWDIYQQLEREGLMSPDHVSGVDLYKMEDGHWGIAQKTGTIVFDSELSDRVRELTADQLGELPDSMMVDTADTAIDNVDAVNADDASSSTDSIEADNAPQEVTNEADTSQASQNQSSLEAKSVVSENNGISGFSDALFNHQSYGGGYDNGINNELFNDINKTSANYMTAIELNDTVTGMIKESGEKSPAPAVVREFKDALLKHNGFSTLGNIPEIQADYKFKQLPKEVVNKILKI